MCDKREWYQVDSDSKKNRKWAIDEGFIDENRTLLTGWMRIDVLQSMGTK